ncbi:hypothetical protein HRG_010114 [Hirsutella rhossiliensis]
MAAPSPQDALIREMRGQIAALTARLNERSPQSCLACFCPFPEGKNPEYSDAAKSRIKVSATFSGKKDEFHSFILSIKNKFDEDVRTFRTENSRMFTVNGKTDIVDFLAEFDYLTATGRVPEDQMKHTLWQHIPANLDNSLLTKTRDESVTYEVFYCSDYRQDSEQDRLDPITSRDAGRALTDDEKRAHWDNGTCFICGKTGHLSRECPDRTHAVSRVASVPVPANDSDQDSGNE